MDCLGTGSIQLQLGEVKHAVEVAVVKQFNGPLLSWQDCITLGILPTTFPQQICTVKCQPTATSATSSEAPSSREKAQAHQQESSCQPVPSVDEPGQPPVWAPRNLVAARHGAPTAAERLEHLTVMKKTFSRVFDTSTLREISGGEMKIELTEDAVPFVISAARNIPFNWREEVKKQLDDLQEKGIIEPVHHPTAWCHPLVPVPKRSADGSVSGCTGCPEIDERLFRPHSNRNKMRPVHGLFSDVAPMQSDTLPHALRHATHQVVKGLGLDPSPRHLNVLDEGLL